MADVMERTPPAGWYPENPELTQLRWWDGSAWTDHTIDPAQDAAIQQSVATYTSRRELREHRGFASDDPAEDLSAASAGDYLQQAGAETSENPPFTAIERFDDPAESRQMTEQIARSYASHPGNAQPESIIHSTVGSESAVSAWWRPVPPALPTLPTRSSTESVWALAFIPWVAALSFLASVLVYTTIMSHTGFLIAGALIPALWMLATANQDRKSLLELGFRLPASSWWILLGPLAYMIARTVSVARITGKGRAPLVLLLVNTVAVPAAVFAAVQFLPIIMGQS